MYCVIQDLASCVAGTVQVVVTVQSVSSSRGRNSRSFLIIILTSDNHDFLLSHTYPYLHESISKSIHGFVILLFMFIFSYRWYNVPVNIELFGIGCKIADII